MSCLAKAYDLEAIDAAEDVRSEISSFRARLDLLQGSRGADLVLRKLPELKRPPFRWLLEQIGQRCGLETADIAGIPDALHGLRNGLFHGEDGIDLDPLTMDEIRRIQCLLERLLLRALGWSAESGSDVDPGTRGNTTLAYLRQSLKRHGIVPTAT